jgi:hypothetical protein
MATLHTRLRSSAVIGSEDKSSGFDRAGLTVTKVHDRLVEVGSSGPVTLWSAAADLPATFDAADIIIDPDGEASGDAAVLIEITASGQTFCFNATRHRPILLGRSNSRATIGGADGHITLLRAQTTSGTVKVRTVIWD